MPSAPIEPQARLNGTVKRPARRLTAAEKAGKLVALCRANPSLWPTIQREAKTQAREHGRVSVPAVFSQQRWAHLVNADASPYKLNNDYAPLFARMLAFKFPSCRPSSRYGAAVTTTLTSRLSCNSQKLPTMSQNASDARFVRVPYAVADAIPRMSKAALSVYIALARHADWQRRTCKASYASIAEWAGVNRKTVGAAIKELEGLGFVSWQRGNKGRSNFYCLPLQPDPATGYAQLLGMPSERGWVDPATGPKVDPATGSRDKTRIIDKQTEEQDGEDERRARLNALYAQVVTVD